MHLMCVSVSYRECDVNSPSVVSQQRLDDMPSLQTPTELPMNSFLFSNADYVTVVKSEELGTDSQ